MAGKNKNVMYDVTSSNISAIGIFDAFDIPSPEFIKRNIIVVKVQFVRGATYAYWPCTQEEFDKAFDGKTALKDWFAKFKEGKTYKEIK